MSDLENVTAALNLEYGANRRYGYQIEGSPFAQMNALLEGVRRTEGDHIEVMMGYIKAHQQSSPDAGRGFATLLAHLRLNMEFEQTAVTAYNRFAREAEDGELKRVFQQLSLAEAGHINLFKDLIARIEANAFPVVMYCPVCGWELHFGANPPEDTVMRCEMCKQQIALRLVEGDFTLEALGKASTHR